MTLDRAKLTAIGHANHVICNPVGVDKVDCVLDLLDLPPGARVLDAGCGKAEILIRLIERRGDGVTGSARITGVGVDTNPRFLEEGRRAAANRVPAGSLELIEGDVVAYLRSAGEGAEGGRGRNAGAGARGRDTAGGGSAKLFDAAVCTGSTHAFGGYRQTLRALARAVHQGGEILIGEGYWKKDPDVGYLAAIGATRTEFTDHAGNVARGVEEGLVPLYTTVSSDEEWDRYEGLYLRAVERYVAAHPEDPDSSALRDHIRRWRDAYLEWGRDTLGFGLYLFRKE